MLDTMLGID